MQIHVVHAHPEPNSFNGALTAKALKTLSTEGHTVDVLDLYGAGFDPVERREHYPAIAADETFSALGAQRHGWKTGTLPEDVTREIAALERADLVILQFPLWWHGPPAILKGWFDRVFVSGGVYSSRMRYDSGYFRGKRAMISVTSGAPEEAFGPGARAGDPEAMLWPVQYSLHYLGFQVLEPFWSFGVQGHGYSYRDDAAMKEHLSDTLDTWAQRLQCIDEAPELSFPGWSDWDENGRAKPGAAFAGENGSRKSVPS